MSTLDQLRTLRTTSGARYAAAVAELKAATIELAALDRAVANKNVSGETVLTFGPLVDPISLRHPEFAASVAGNWTAEIEGALRTRVAEFPTPDEE